MCVCVCLCVCVCVRACVLRFISDIKNLSFVFKTLVHSFIFKVGGDMPSSTRGKF